MLHEVLLALSGHSSPLFDAGVTSHEDDISYVSSTERALLASIGQLSNLHRRLKSHLEAIASRHQSVIARATAISIQKNHLGRFQQKILDVESRILKQDPVLVGAYDIVPLAGVVAEFDDWHRRMAWYWAIATFMTPPPPQLGDHAASRPASSSLCTGAGLIDKLRSETRTGFTDLEVAAVELCKVAEAAWLKQLSSWIVYGKLQPFGELDFFVQKRTEGAKIVFVKEKSLLPSFVTPPTATTILFVGRSLHQIAQLRTNHLTAPDLSLSKVDNAKLADVHLNKLSSLQLPTSATQLSAAIADIHLSLSQNVLQHLLPLETTLTLLSSLQQFFLLNRSDFAVVLIAEVEKHMMTRHSVSVQAPQPDPFKAMAGLTIKDPELVQILHQTWRTLALSGHDEEDKALTFAEENLTFSTTVDQGERPSTSDSSNLEMPTISTVAFDDLLLPTRARLSFKVSPPLDLFITSRDLDTYSSISSYLLGIRRGCIRLNELWKRDSGRREKSSHSSAPSPNDSARKRDQATAARKIWATCSAANLLLSETAAFLEGEVVQGSCRHFRQWVEAPLSPDESNTDHAPSHRDPETLAAGHRAFLASLTFALLLTDMQYTRELRSLLGNVDGLIGLFGRQLDLQQKLDQERVGSGVESAYTREEEARTALELDRARKKVDSDLRAVVSRLRQLDAERIGSLRYLSLTPSERDGFEPWKGGGVDRLLMKLEFGRMTTVDAAQPIIPLQ